MRVRSFAALVVLLPAVLDAQGRLRPSIGVRVPVAPVPQRPAVIAREMASAYTRLNFTFEAYPLLSRVSAPGGGWSSSYTILGTGMRLEYALARYVAATADVTSSYIGGPRTETLELGTRIHQPRSEGKVYPFLDLRVGYMYLQNTALRNIGSANGIGVLPQAEFGRDYSFGFGSVAGAGVEYALTNTLSLTSAGSWMQSRLTRRSYDNRDAFDDRYTSNWFRTTIGIRYNPVRYNRQPGTDGR